MKRTKEEIEERHKKFTQSFGMLLEHLIENENLEQYREFLICRILQEQTEDKYTRDDLLKKSTMELEDIFENIN